MRKFLLIISLFPCLAKAELWACEKSITSRIDVVGIEGLHYVAESKGLIIVDTERGIRNRDGDFIGTCEKSGFEQWICQNKSNFDISTTTLSAGVRSFTHTEVQFSSGAVVSYAGKCMRAD